MLQMNYLDMFHVFLYLFEAAFMKIPKSTLENDISLNFKTLKNVPSWDFYYDTHTVTFFL
jgi:hypothetical protein